VKADYCVLRNYEAVYTYEGIGDIDILVAKKDFQKINDILVYKFGFSIKFELPWHVMYVLYTPEVSEFIHIDVYYGGLRYGGILYLPEKEILDRKEIKYYFYIPSSEDALIALLLHSIIDINSIKSKYISKLNLLEYDKKIDVEYINKMISKLFGVTVSNVLFYLLTNRFEKLNKFELICLKIYLLFQRIVRDPCNIISFFRIIKIKTSNFLNFSNKGIIISLIGVDGCGKTTTAKKLKRILLRGEYKADTVYMGWKDFMLPIPNALIKEYSKMKKKNDLETIHDIKFVNKKKLNFVSFLEFLKDLIYPLEFIIRYVIKIKPKKMRGYILITDRYPYDKIILQKKLNVLTKWCIYNLLPRPDYIFYLNTDSYILLQRRSNEITLDEIIYQKKCFEKYKEIIKFKKINADNVDHTCDIIINNILNKFYLM